MSEAFQPFEIKVGERTLQLELGKCAVCLFRKKQEVDYIALQDPEDEEEQIRIFNNQEFARWVGGYTLQLVDGEIERPTMWMEFDDEEHHTFREINGWNPVVIEREEPSEKEIEMWLDVQIRGIDEEWGEL